MMPSSGATIRPIARGALLRMAWPEVVWRSANEDYTLVAASESAARPQSGDDQRGLLAGINQARMLQAVTRGLVESERLSKGAGSRSPGREGDGRTGTALIAKPKPRTKRPNLYRVLLLNDDYTPMEFVVLVLERFFNKSREDATRIMLHVHHNGVGECGIYTYEVAETKVTQVMDFARKHQHPLQCVMEKK